ncbi:hypothetical protein GCK72_006953 [Caenorhabditis remanei]|uniref:C-type lectin domain-containing protein n=1 Tax=Caenorhabditis remanei TaxID=31234 RepID=A0A6A5HHN5_CAERE|nr:hypothetical protein GCK72_006953 [Caenorhabditis remanei]KAF1766995.1 hypothetical protein GCK72_006953 [Caenorhabditis remanei]
MKSSVLGFLLCISSALAYVEVAMNCTDGWDWFKRSRGGWCMKVFSEKMNQGEAEAKCNEEGAVLAGVQNGDEVKWMAESLVKLVGKGNIWIGAKRSIPCRSVSGFTALCTDLTSFYWTDASTTGFLGFKKWLVGEPTNWGLYQHCIVLSSTARLMDDVACNIKATGYVCGKLRRFDFL